MKLKLYLKTGLMTLAALLAFGVQANAQDGATTVYERGTTTAWDSARDISATEWSKPASGTLDINNGLHYTSPNNGSGYTQKTISLTKNSIVTVHAVWNTGSSTGRPGNYNYLNIGDLKIKNYGQDQKAGIQVGDDQEVTILDGNTKKTDNRGATWTIDLTINQANGAITYNITSTGGGSAKGELSHADGSYTTLRLGFERGGRTVTSNSTLNSINISEEVQAVTTATYTVKFVDEQGNDLKDADVRTGVVGDAITISDADKVAIYNADKTAKYAYASDDSEGKTITADNSAVVTITFKALDKVTATLNAVNADGNVLKEGIASGTTFPGDEITIYYPKSITVDGTIYDIAQNAAEPYYGIKVSDGGTNVVTYSPADYNYFAECENMSTSRSNAIAAHGAVTGRYSSGDAVRLYRGSYLYLSGIAPGKYTVTVWGRNQSRSDDNIIVTTRNSEGNLSTDTLGVLNWSAAASTTKTIENATITDGTIVLKNPSDTYNNNIELDYITLTKTGDLTTSVTIDATSKLTSFSNASAVTLPENSEIVVYIATASDENTVTLKKVDTNVIPANTGVILYSKEAGERTLTLGGESTADFSENVLKAAVEPVVAGANDYALVKGQQAFAHVKEGVTIPAGKAYLETAAGSKLNISFDGTATGINSINADAAELSDKAPMFNLAGQRVNKSFKGVIIQNGKKFINK